jgi:phosphatidate cytidylyltransferase
MTSTKSLPASSGLKQRIITAIVLLAGLLAALFLLPLLYWGMLMALVAAVAAWEWGALAGLKQRGRLVFGGGMLLATAYFSVTLPFGKWGFPLDAFAASMYPAYAILSVAAYLFPLFFWCLLAPLWLKKRWHLNQTHWGQAMLLLLGGNLIFATWLAFNQLRSIHPVMLLYILGIAWVSDISAYLVGRKFGGKKLAPNISPGKTWAGVWGTARGDDLFHLDLASHIRFPSL